ncbi:MAG: lysophospholipid acyltransferase family protein [Gallionella sp.]|nr:lysophospholipid acyltransferase family protein [Gallionella sp.]
MVKRSPNRLVSVFRGCRLALHLLHGMLLALFYPFMDQARQRRTLKNWSRQILGILNIGIQIDGLPPARDGTGCLMVANHVSWLDIFVLNAIHPSLFIAKSEVRSWPLIGWLCERSGTIFIERSLRQNAASINQRISTLLNQGVSVGLFPEGTTTDGKQVGHFHSALIQPAVDAGVSLCPIALHYRDEAGELSTAAAFTGDTTLAQSIWQILCCQQLNSLVIFTPALITSNENRRVLSRAAQQAIALKLANIAPHKRKPEQISPNQEILSSQSAYALLISQDMGQTPR